MDAKNPLRISTGDHVFHRPSRETWIVSFVHGGTVYGCDWPMKQDKIVHFNLIHKASKKEAEEVASQVEIYVRNWRFWCRQRHFVNAASLF